MTLNIKLWTSWLEGHEEAQKNFRDTRSDKKDEFDSTLEGAWLKRFINK